MTQTERQRAATMIRRWLTGKERCGGFYYVTAHATLHEKSALALLADVNGHVPDWAIHLVRLLEPLGWTPEQIADAGFPLYLRPPEATAGLRAALALTLLEQEAP